MKLTSEQEDRLVSSMEEMGIPASKANEILIELQAGGEASEEAPPSAVEDLRVRLLHEDDWRVRARLAAMIISKNLE